jgi:hypothetical protein
MCYVVRTLNALLQDLFYYRIYFPNIFREDTTFVQPSLENPVNAYDLVPSFSTRRRIRPILTVF